MEISQTPSSAPPYFARPDGVRGIGAPSASWEADRHLIPSRLCRWTPAISSPLRDSRTLASSGRVSERASATFRSQDTLTKFMADTLRVVAGTRLRLPAPIAISRPGNRFPLILQSFVSPNGNGQTAYGILKLRDGSEFRIPTVEMIRSATRLTEAEARLAIGLVRGQSVADYARYNGLSEHTVRTHLRNIRDKLRIRRQSDVVAFFMRLT